MDDLEKDLFEACEAVYHHSVTKHQMEARRVINVFLETVHTEEAIYRRNKPWATDKEITNLREERTRKKIDIVNDRKERMIYIEYTTMMKTRDAIRAWMLNKPEPDQQPLEHSLPERQELESRGT